MMKITSLRCAAYAVAVACLGLVSTSSDQASANTILNGSFESPVVAANSFQQATPASWTWANSVGLIFNGNAGSPWPLAQDGQQFVDIGNTSLGGSYTLSQQFTIAASGNYELQWYDNAAIAGPLTSPYQVSVLDGSQQTVVNAGLDAFHGGQWQLQTLSMSLNPGNYSLTFTAGGAALDTLLDNVTLAPVPEPTSLVMLAVGSVGLLILIRRKSHS